VRNFIQLKKIGTCLYTWFVLEEERDNNTVWAGAAFSAKLTE
jgi:hypothetical protein